MAGATLRPLLVGLLLLGLFSLSVVNFGLLLAEHNNPSQSIGNDPTLLQYKLDIEDTLQSAQTEANTAEQAIGESPITLENDFFGVSAIGGIWKTLKNAPFTIYNLTVGLIMTRIFGSNGFAVALGIISTIITITLIFGVWKFIHSGEGG